MIASLPIEFLFWAWFFAGSFMAVAFGATVEFIYNHFFGEIRLKPRNATKRTRL